MDTEPPPYPASSPMKPLAIGLGALLALSVVGNIALLLRGPRVEERRVVVPAVPPMCPPAPTCPECPAVAVVSDGGACPACPECPAAVVADHGGVRPGVPRPPRPPPIDRDAEAEGEAHVAHAAAVAERDPVQVAAQRRLADGSDRIVASRSPAAALRFIQRNLPSFASMDCAFRDPAAAEHVRMRLRDMNALVPAENQLSEADLTRYERDLRCPRE
ncbi:MAG: hypothetical protein R3A52_01075 [Polyangiales bacterium]